MRKSIIIAAITALAAGCAAPAEMQVRVTPLGQEVEESTEQGIYVLPRTVMKVDLICEEVKSVPGPFREYADKYLGITEVINQKTSSWQILDATISAHEEMDPQMVFQVHLIEGSMNPARLETMMEKGVIMDGTTLVREEIKSPALGVTVKRDYVQYKDLGIDSNFEERTETMYKTIVTDTSFLEVPVNRTITEQKSLSKKAEEAADFILELRTRRFELLTGEYDDYPQGEAMKATLDKLDELEESYLSLFIGRTLVKRETRSWFVAPESGSSAVDYPLALFSEDLGFVPEELKEGLPLQIRIEPLGNTRDLNAYFSNQITGEQSNVFYYRVPDVVNLKLMLGVEELATQRITLYQAGSLISAPL